MKIFRVKCFFKVHLYYQNALILKKNNITLKFMFIGIKS